MSPRQSHADTYTCDQCGTTQDEPIHAGWFQVDRPPGISYPRIDDWWQETRYFCSASCLAVRLAKETGDWVSEHPPGKWFAADPSVGPHRFSPVQGTRRYCLLFIGSNTICGKEQDDPIHRETP